MSQMQEAASLNAIPTEGWFYRASVQGPASIFNYKVALFRDGRSVCSGYADTKRGARREARSLRRRVLRRERMAGESGVLR